MLVCCDLFVMVLIENCIWVKYIVEFGMIEVFLFFLEVDIQRMSLCDDWYILILKFRNF